MKIRAYAALSATTALQPFEIDRREPAALDVAIDVLFCGVCHSDLHQARGEWNSSQFPMVPGHEIIGRVARVGDQITTVKPGDLVGVGCMVDSCHVWAVPRDHEQFCQLGTVDRSREAKLQGPFTVFAVFDRVGPGQRRLVPVAHGGQLDQAADAGTSPARCAVGRSGARFDRNDSGSAPRQLNSRAVTSAVRPTWLRRRYSPVHAHPPTTCVTNGQAAHLAAACGSHRDQPPRAR